MTSGVGGSRAVFDVLVRLRRRIRRSARRTGDPAGDRGNQAFKIFFTRHQVLLLCRRFFSVARGDISKICQIFRWLIRQVFGRFDRDIGRIRRQTVRGVGGFLIIMACVAKTR